MFTSIKKHVRTFAFLSVMFINILLPCHSVSANEGGSPENPSYEPIDSPEDRQSLSDISDDGPGILNILDEIQGQLSDIDKSVRVPSYPIDEGKISTMLNNMQVQIDALSEDLNKHVESINKQQRISLIIIAIIAIIVAVIVVVAEKLVNQKHTSTLEDDIKAMIKEDCGEMLDIELRRFYTVVTKAIESHESRGGISDSQITSISEKVVALIAPSVRDEYKNVAELTERNRKQMNEQKKFFVEFAKELGINIRNIQKKT